MCQQQTYDPFQKGTSRRIFGRFVVRKHSKDVAATAHRF